MKLLICTLLLLGIHELNCAPLEDENDNEERKYGLGFDVGGSYKGGVAFGVNSKDGSHSVFLDKTASAKANAGVGVYKSVKPFVLRTPPSRPQYYPYPVPYDTRYSVPVYNAYPVQYDPRYLVPQYNTFPNQYPYDQY